MKLLPLLPALLLPVFSQAQAVAGYEVVGHLAGLADNTKLYLIDGSQRKRIDSATVQHGQFVFRGKLAEPVHTYLYAGRGPGSSKLADILLDNRQVFVSGTQPLYDSIAVHGSDIDQHLKDWYRADTQLSLRRSALAQQYKAKLSQPDTAGAGHLKHQMGQLQLDRVSLLKTYVRRYHDTAAGAALPTLCTLGASLTAADYQEMYQVLTPQWQQSAFGHEILAQAKKRTAVK